MVGTFSSFARRFIRPVAMILITGGLALSLIVTTPSNAYAFKQKFPVTPTFVMGAVKTVAPVAMAAVSVTPVGWGLRIIQLGMLAYSTSDMWMPFVTGTFGAMFPDQPAGAGYRVQPGLRLVSVGHSTATKTWIEYVYSYDGSQGNQAAGITFEGRCKSVSTGSGHPIGTEFTGNVASPSLFSTGTAAMTSVTISKKVCPDGSEVIGSKVGPPATSMSGTWRGPENFMSSGTLAPAGFDPRSNDVGYVGKSECIDAAGTKSWVVGPEIPGDNGAMLMPSCEKAGKGHGTGRTTVTAFKPDGTQETVWDTGAQPLSDPATPLCDPGRATSGCVMEVLKDDKPCSPGDVECENWQEESGKDPTRWKCKFGPYTLPLSACNLLSRAYSPNGAPVNDENTDGDPLTNSNLGPSGQPAPAPAPSVTGTGTTTAPAPGGSGQTAPSADEKSRQCFPTGWAAFNPVEWVMKPVGCALEAAFVPKPETVRNQQTRVQTKLTTIGFAPITAAWESTYQAAGGGSGCSGPTINFSMNGVEKSLQPFQACTEPMSTVAGIANACSAIVLVLFGGLGVLRAVGSAFGFNFTLGKGGDSE